MIKSILLINDDGIDSEGLRVLESALQAIACLIVVAPNGERSAVSHGLTVRQPLEYKEINPFRYAVNGTPADCVIFALRKLFIRFPDLVISGINHGANLGDDIMYSGTVAAAREASRHGIPAMAISQAYEDGKAINFREGAAFVRDLVSAMLQNGLNGEICLNVNIPVRKIKGMKITRQGCSEHTPHFNIMDSHQELDRLPVMTGPHPKDGIPSDHQAILDHYVSITPLQRDQTDFLSAQLLMRDAERLFSMK
jgi:5'-nucleotidase